MLHRLEVVYPSTLAIVNYSRLELGEGALIRMATFMLTNCHSTRLSDVCVCAEMLHLFWDAIFVQMTRKITQDFATLLQESGFGNSLKVAASNPIGFDG